MKSIKLIIGVLTIFFTNTINAQSSIKIGGDVGRAYYYYKFQDYGQGAKNLPSANYGFTAELTITKELDQKNQLSKVLKNG